MSVLNISKQTFGRVAATIADLPAFADYFLTHTEKLECDVFKTDQQKKLDITVKAWSSRLHIANQLAFQTMYNKDDAPIVIAPMTDADFRTAHWYQVKELLHELESIQYNLYTNAGRSFTSQEDMERLERMIDVCKDKIIHSIDIQDGRVRA